ncbi:hypothetical protein [Streptomyces sp. NPDC059258]|uniref:hypothetical protein n=1 Tax=unclassified Streptomyces TaxID=2593676 RepID=UPI0036861DB6
MTQKTVVKKFPAGAPRGSWPAEEYAAGLRAHGRSIDVVMDLSTDTYLIVDATDVSTDKQT